MGPVIFSHLYLGSRNWTRPAQRAPLRAEPSDQPFTLFLRPPPPLYCGWRGWRGCDAPATTLRWCWGSTSPHNCTALYPRVTSQPKAYLLNHDTQYWLRCSSASATAPPNSSFVPFPTNTGNTHSGKRDTTSQQHRPGGILLR